MKIVCVAITALMAFSGTVFASNESDTQLIAKAVQSTTMTVDGRIQDLTMNPDQLAELTRALAALPSSDKLVAKWRPGAPCSFNCPPPVGSVTASPSVVSVPSGGLGSVSIRWTWDESHSRPVTQYSCLWVSGNDEPDAHVVQCE